MTAASTRVTIKSSAIERTTLSNHTDSEEPSVVGRRRVNGSRTVDGGGARANDRGYGASRASLQMALAPEPEIPAARCLAPRNTYLSPETILPFL